MAEVPNSHDHAEPDWLEAIEATSYGFGELDERGCVWWHNRALGDLLGRPSLVGETFFDWIAGGGDLASRYRQIVSAAGGSIKHRLVTLQCSDGTRKVDFEICVTVRHGASSAHLFLKDSSSYQAQERAFAEADFGVIRIGPKGEIVGCNKHIAERLGGRPEDYVGRLVRDIAADEKAVALADRELERRQRGEASTFILKARAQDAAPRHVRVVAFPEFDEDGTTRIGTLAFARMIEPEYVSKALNAKLFGSDEVYQQVEFIHSTIAPLVPHESLVFSICDESGAWSWPVHVVPPPDRPWATRWFPISPAMRDWTRGARDEFGNVLINNVESWYQALPQDEPIRHDQTVQDLIRGGVRSSLSVPYFLEDKLVASMSLLRTSDRPFDIVESSYLDTLQLKEITLGLALQYSQRERGFLADLHRVVAEAIAGPVVSSISAARDSLRHQEVGEYVTCQLCKFYRWRAVEIFEVDRVGRRFSPLASCEWVGDNVVLASKTARQVLPLEEGLLGAAYASGRTQHYPPRRKNEPHLAEIPVETPFEGNHPWAKSSINIPVKLKGRVVWIISIEDDRLDAFNEQEEAKLTQFVEHMQSALERLYMESLLTEIFDRASDIILVVDADGRICFANDRAATVLRTTSTALAGQPLVDVLMEPDDAARLLGPSRIQDVRCALRRPNDEKPSYVIASAASWQYAFGLKVIYASELEVQSWHSDLRVIEGALAQAARQSSNALMRLYDFVQRLPEVVRNVNVTKEKELAEKHLADVKLTYDRIRSHLPEDDERYGNKDSPIVDLARLAFVASREAAPDLTPASWVKFSNCHLPCAIVGRQDDLAFVMRSILDYLRRRKADASHVRVVLRAEGVDAPITLEFAANTELLSLPMDPFDAAFASGVEMASLGTGALRRIIEEEHGGRFEHGRRRHDKVEVFSLTFPRTEGQRTQGKAT
ncbi:PAS domain-containing protein [Rhizobium laguerreae]|uniref:PAS domain-containing protein n=1 Tax=Rhizobium laguerreae TaxID=1076926 RepID=UPI001C91DC8B|nr:PAS domain-containing protein [Rhizobium laguerreae]MBY3187921.1 PAS domain-containing protein [Rhizobium laguerreae]